MNSKQHIEISTIGSAAIAGIADLIIQKNNQRRNPEHKFDYVRLAKSIAIGGVCGYVTSTLPDKIEPATSPHHRQFFHSLTCLALLFFGNGKLQSANMPPELKQIINYLSVGYGLHLAADSTTVKGLPLI